MTDLSRDQALEILGRWAGRNVNVQVRGTGSDLGRVLAVLSGRLSEPRDNVPDWTAFAVGDPSGAVAITLYEPEFERAESDSEDYLELYFQGGSITIGPGDTADEGGA